MVRGKAGLEKGLLYKSDSTWNLGRLRLGNSVYNGRMDDKRPLQASVTVEASLILFLFLLFFFCILYFYQILNLELKLQSALEQTADTQAAYAAVRDYHDEKGQFSYIQCGLDYTYAYASVVKNLGEEYLENSWISQGKRGLHFEKSQFLKDGKNLRLIVHYQIKIPYFPGVSLSVIQQAHRRIWVGEDTSIYNKSGGKNNRTYYLATTGRVYHLYRDCDYIDVKLEAVSAAQLDLLRSKDGSIYYACESCHPQKKGLLYIAAYGNRYHAVPTCRAIEKNARQVSEEEIEGMKLCSRCAAQSSQGKAGNRI